MRKFLTTMLVILTITSCTAPPAITPTPTKIIPTILVNTETPARPLATPTPTAVHCNPMPPSSSSGSTTTDIFDANKRIQRTINLGEALEFADKGNWKWVDNEQLFYVLTDAGFNAIRIPVNFASHATSSEPYTINESFWQSVDSIADKAIKCGLVAIINMHNFGFDSQIPYDKSEVFLSLWNLIATHYQDYSETSLYFELYNEPGDPQYWNTLLNKGISVIRKSNPSRPIIVGLADWSQPSGLSYLKLPEDQNLILTFHYYTPMEFTHQGAHWISGADKWLGTTWEATPEQITVINQDFDRISKWSQNRKVPLPIFVGEFGSLSRADSDSRIKWAAVVRKAAEDHNFSWGYWDLCVTGAVTFGIFNCPQTPASTGKWNEGLYNALIPH